MGEIYNIKSIHLKTNQQLLEGLVEEYLEICNCLLQTEDPIAIVRLYRQKASNEEQTNKLAQLCERLQQELQDLQERDSTVSTFQSERNDISSTLLEIVTYYEQSILSNLENAYIAVAKPVAYSRRTPMTLIGKLANLNDMQSDQGYSVLLKFAAYLICDQQIPEMLSTRLNAWANEQTPNFSWVLGQVRRSNLVNQQHRQSYLMIKVEPTFASKKQSENHYAVKAWFIADEQKYQTESSMGIVSLSTVEDEYFTDTEEVFTIAEIEKLIPVFIYNSAKCGLLPNLTIELFLPDELLNESVDSWKMDDGDSVFPIGSKYKFILRSTQRLQRKQFTLSRSYWQQKWNNMPEPGVRQSTGLLVTGDNISYECLFQELEPPHIMGLTFVENSLQIGKNSSVAALRSVGAPIAMWLRQPLSNVDQTTIDSLLTCCLHDLPDVVKQQRLASLTEAPGSHIGHHLALLWDNFDRLPPDLDFYMS